MKNFWLIILAFLLVFCSDNDEIFLDEEEPLDASVIQSTDEVEEDTETFFKEDTELSEDSESDSETDIGIIFDTDVNIDYEYYCEECSEDLPCPDDGVCVIIQQEEEMFCTGDCYNTYDCPGQLVCVPVYIISGVCLPINYKKTCEELINALPDLDRKEEEF